MSHSNLELSQLYDKLYLPVRQMTEETENTQTIHNDSKPIAYTQDKV